MVVTALSCSCGTGVTGRFAPAWRDLSPDQAEFARLFVALRGNLKEMQRTLGLSYGALRARLDAVVQRLGGGPEGAGARPDRSEHAAAVIARLEAGEIDADTAVRMLGVGTQDEED
jgi:hypothetical protein